MKFSTKDIVKLRLPLLGTVALFVIGGLLAAWSVGEAEKATRERNTATASKNQIEQRLRQVRTEEQELKEKAQIFQQMQDAGITGEEKRLEWTEMLQQIQHDLRIPGMNYEFGIQKPLENVNGAAYAYYASAMRLQLHLLHEGDLINILDRIQKEAKALVLVRSCKLSPLAARSEGRDALAQLAAECELQWVTVRRSNGKK
jgi:hypothetical protein